MAFKALYGLETSLVAATVAGAGQLQIDPNVANQISTNLGGGNYTYVSLSDGINYELVQIIGVNSPNLIVNRAQSGTTSSNFPIGACLRYVWTSEGIAVTAAAINFSFTGQGAAQVTQTGPSAWNINVPIPVITDNAPIQVLGAYPAWEIAIASNAGNCCCGGGSGGGGSPVTITGSGIINVTGSDPNFVIGAQAVNLIAGSGINIVGSYPTFTISATGGGGGGGVTSVNGSAKILISGAPTTPTVSLITTGIGTDTYNGITYDNYGTITALDLSYIPIVQLASVSAAISITLGIGPGHLNIGTNYATTTQVGVVQLAPPTAVGSNNASDSTSAVTPAGINAVLAAIGSGTVQGSSNFGSAPAASYINALTSTVSLNLTGTQKALITACVQNNDTTSPLPPWGFAVFNGVTLMQGLAPTPSHNQTIQFIVNAPFSGVLGMATTSTMTGAMVQGQSIFATITAS